MDTIDDVETLARTLEQLAHEALQRGHEANNVGAVRLGEFARGESCGLTEAARLVRQRARSEGRLIAMMERACESMAREISDARAVIGEGWFADGTRTLAEAITIKTRRLEEIVND